MELPGFRFHPTEEELLSFYLGSVVVGKKVRGDVIGFLNIYNHDPRELPGLATIGEREWYFYVPRDRRKNAGRPNRTTKTGYWKATGSDRKVLTTSHLKKTTTLGLKKTLVFYEGRAPCGRKTDWVMNEYRLLNTDTAKQDVVLCKVYRKATSLKVLEQMAAMEEDHPSPLPDFISFRDATDSTCTTTTHLMLDQDSQVPDKFSMDCNQESSPFWLLDSVTQFLPTC